MAEGVQQVRVGLVGCGRVAQMLHLRVLASLSAVRVTALAEPDDARRSEAQAKVPSSAAVADYRDLLGRDDVDAVVICLPTGLHAEAGAAAFDAGKHVYLEKPVAHDAAGLERLLAAWRASGRVGVVGFNYRFHPVYLDLKRRLAAGEVGPIVGVRTSFASAARALPPWKRRRASGGGALLDLASHHVDLVRFVLGREVAEASATIRSVKSEEDTAALTLRLDDGTAAQTFASMSAADEDRFEVIGTRGKLSVDRQDGTVSFAPAGRAYGRAGPIKRAMAGASARGPAWARAVVRPGLEPSFAPSLAAFADAVLGRRPATPDLLDGAKSLAVILAAEESSRTGRPVAPHVPGEPAVILSAPTFAPAATDDAPLEEAGDGPRLTAVVVATGGFASVRRTVRHLRAQTIADRIELVMVAPRVEDLDDAGPDEVAGFQSVERVACGPIGNIDAATAVGLRAGSAPVLASVEDHAYPDADWAEAILAAYAGPSPPAAVGSVMLNANPATGLSWMNLLMGYGPWCAPAGAGSQWGVAKHNVSFRRSALVPYFDGLEDKMGRSGTLLEEMASAGGALHLAPAARVRHVNPSRLSSSLALRFDGGRLFAGARTEAGRYGLAKRVAFAGGSVLIPLLRLRVIRPKLGPAGWRSAPAVALGLVVDAAGQALGFALGPGDTKRRLEAFEFDRDRHLTRRDRESL